jgi:signal transduction histidine kinase
MSDQRDGNVPEFRVHVEGAPRELIPMVRDEVYRIAGEALRNARRHAQAGRIEVSIRYGGRQFRLLVRDNGKGIERKVLDDGYREGHHGLQGMRERAKVVNGELIFSSKPDSGTEVALTISAAIAYVKQPAPRRRISIFSGKGA